MILGIGTDLVDLRRIERTLARFGARFCARVFTQEERERCERSATRVGRYGQRYAAKEACAKALGTGFREGVAWRDIEVRSLSSGKPVLCLKGGALRRLARMTPGGMIARLDVTMTDEPPMAHAVVVISAVRAKKRPSRRR
jgi:holo-[acyl-carrier protein] synthase